MWKGYEVSENALFLVLYHSGCSGSRESHAFHRFRDSVLHHILHISSHWFSVKSCMAMYSNVQVVNLETICNIASRRMLTYLYSSDFYKLYSMNTDWKTEFIKCSQFWPLASGWIKTVVVTGWRIIWFDEIYRKWEPACEKCKCHFILIDVWNVVTTSSKN